MSEKLQHTAQKICEQMKLRYGEILHHKHDKNHMPFRKHCRTHPVDIEDHEIKAKKSKDSCRVLMAKVGKKCWH